MCITGIIGLLVGSLTVNTIIHFSIFNLSLLIALCGIIIAKIGLRKTINEI